MRAPVPVEGLAPETITARLRTRRYGRSLDVRAETDSTNDDAREAAARGAPDGHVVLADRQRAGRGARGHAWDSPGGDDLYLSIVARLPLAPAQLPPLTLAVGVAVADTVAERAPGARIDIKWPNDVRIDGAKCAGALVESVSVGQRLDSLVIGVGLDVNRRVFGAELEGIATSLARATGVAHDRVDVLVALLGRVEASVDRFVAYGAADVVARVEPRLAWRGARVACGDVVGELAGLRDDGALLLRVDGQQRAVLGGALRRAL